VEKKAHDLIPLFVTQGKGVDPETMIERRGDKYPVKAFLFGAGKTADSVNPGHG